jgi:hypothetical protein
VEFSIDDGKTWTGVYPSNVGNTGQYDWLVPLVDADKCLIRVFSSDNLGVYDVSDTTFSIYELSLVGDIAADCPVDVFKLVFLNWL